MLQTLALIFPECKASLSTSECSLKNKTTPLKEKIAGDFRNQHKMLFMLWLRLSSEAHTDPGFTLNNIYISINVVHFSGGDNR